MRWKENAVVGGRRCKIFAVFTYAGSPCHNVALRLAAARSRSGSDTPPACHSLPSRRFATSQREADKAVALATHGGREENVAKTEQKRSRQGSLPRRGKVSRIA